MNYMSGVLNFIHWEGENTMILNPKIPKPVKGLFEYISLNVGCEIFMYKFWG